MSCPLPPPTGSPEARPARASRAVGMVFACRGSAVGTQDRKDAH